MARSAFVVICVLASAAAVFAQRTVTNADLEKYRQSRLAAERDLRENYEKLGFPSPEELERRNEESARARDELSAQLREERLERDRMLAEMRAREAEAAQPTVIVLGEGSGGYSAPIYGYGAGYGYGYGDDLGRVPLNRKRDRYWGYGGPQVIWRAGPGGVIYEPGGRSSYVWSPRYDRPRRAFQPQRPATVRPRPILRPVLR